MNLKFKMLAVFLLMVVVFVVASPLLNLAPTALRAFHAAIALLLTLGFTAVGYLVVCTQKNSIALVSNSLYRAQSDLLDLTCTRLI